MNRFEVTIVTVPRKFGIVKTVTVRDFRTRPREVRQELEHAREAVLTANGKPFALVLPVTLENYEETLRLVRRARAMQALDAIHRHSVTLGTDGISQKQINVEIAETRQARKKRTASK